MKKVIFSIVAVLMITMMTLGVGCTTAAATTVAATTVAATTAAATTAATTAAAESEKKNIVFVCMDMSATYASWLAASVEQIAKEKYPHFNLKILDAKMDVAVEIGILENLMVEKPDMILMTPVDTPAMAEPINKVIDSGIPVCIVNMPKTGSPKASDIDADLVEQGALPAKYAVDLIPQNAKVVVMLGPAGNPHSAGRRIGWQQEFFDKRTDVELLDEQIGNWMKDEGMALMEDWLQRFPQIDAICSMNDSMALGGIEAIKAANRMKGMTFYGVDGLGDACLSIKAGELTATCLQNAYAQAEAGLEVCDKVTKGLSEMEEMLVPGDLITLDNVDKYIAIHKASGQIK